MTLQAHTSRACEAFRFLDMAKRMLHKPSGSQQLIGQPFAPWPP